MSEYPKMKTFDDLPVTIEQNGPDGFTLEHTRTGERKAYAIARPVSTVVDEVLAERVRQDAKWGGPAHDDTHVLSDWWGFIRERLDTLQYPLGPADERRDLIEVAALAIAAVESMDRKAATNG